MGLMAAAHAEYFNFSTDVLDQWAKTNPGANGLWCVDAASGAERKFTFRELSVLSRQAANYFEASGVKRGHCVLLMVPRIWQWWVSMLGLIRIGAIPVPATLLMTQGDVAYRLKTAGVTALITTADGMEKAGDFKGLRFLAAKTAPARGWLDFDAGVKAANRTHRATPTRRDDPGIIYFTSATTGEPKMVLHTQGSYGLGHRLTGELLLDCRFGETHWNISDLGWGKAAWSSFYGPWHMGACVFALDFSKFDPVLILDTLSRYPIATWCVPATALRLIVRQDLSRWKFPTLRYCVTAGESLNPEVFKIWQAATGLELHEGYGQTETVVLVGNFKDRRICPGSMGQATPGMPVVVLDNNLQEVPPGHEGEIALRVKPTRPPGLFKEYLDSPEAMAEHFRGDWYLTGDRAVRDADGYFWFVGRKDDVIKSSGYRIGPSEVESVMLEHPAVLDVAVVGMPDKIRGQIVKAFVVLNPEYPPTDNLRRELQQYCKSTTAPFKYPREIEFLHALPKTISDKTRRFKLRETAPNARLH
jgi:acetyl-CoA synthetase/medium-chain acyl-CoA synthetase